MAFSIQTNVASLAAQDNLRVNGDFQSRTIQRLTSGYRINSSGDDAAGLSIANKFRSDTAELTQGVRNANDGVSQLQIVDGGLNNIAKILDRMKTLATQSASTTFTGDRTILNNEYQSLVSEIDRQASNIKLDSGGTLNSYISVYIGGATATGSTKGTVNIDLSGNANAVDATRLGVSGTAVSGGGNAVTNGQDLTAANAKFLTGGSQTFTLNYVDSNGTAQTASIVAHSNANGASLSSVLSDLNSQLSQYGITASTSTATATKGYLQFSSAKAFSIKSTASAGTDYLLTTGATGVVDNASMYSLASVAGATNADSNGQVLQFSSGGKTATVTFSAAITSSSAKANAINNMVGALGITAVVNSAGLVTVESQSAFQVVNLANATVGATANALGSSALGEQTITSPTAGTSDTGTATSALTLIANAVGALGGVQGVVGAGQNKLQYAINLAQSQISNFSAAESRIRDADVAAEAANLTKAQVLQQASLAAMAQANSAPQAIMSLLR